MIKSQRKFAIALLAFVPLLAGQHATAQMSIGVKGGINLSAISIDRETNTSFSTRVAPTFGIIFNYKLSPFLSIQAEPGFSQRGAKIKEVEVEIINNVTYRMVNSGSTSLNYFELPIVAQYRPQLGGKLEGIISFGPEVRFLTVNQKIKLVSKTYLGNELVETTTNVQTLPRDDGFGKFDFGLVGGAGVAYPFGRVKVFAEARYHLGLYNVIAHLNDPNSKAYNRGGSITMGVTVPIGKN
jgi:hypothetical protein